MKYLELTIGAILVYNFVLARFLGICPFLGVSKRLGTAMGMSGAVVFVMTIASFITSLIYRYLLKFEIDGTPYDLSFLQVLLFILVIAGRGARRGDDQRRQQLHGAGGDGVRPLLRHRLCAGTAAFLEPARTARPRRSSETVPGNPDRPHHRRNPGDGVRRLLGTLLTG